MEAQCVLCEVRNEFISVCLFICVSCSLHVMFEGIIPRFLSSFMVYIAENSCCNECRDRRFGGLYVLRVKVGRSPEMVDVRLRGQAISTPSPLVCYVSGVSSCTTFRIVNGCLQQSVLSCCALCVRFVTQVVIVFC